MADDLFLNNSSSDFSQNLRDLLVPLAESIAVLRIDSNWQQAIIRFHNNYGVCILPTSLGEGKRVFETLVVRFTGLGLNDYELAQYVRVPEINWHYAFENILLFCKQVSSL